MRLCSIYTCRNPQIQMLVYQVPTTITGGIVGGRSDANQYRRRVNRRSDETQIGIDESGIVKRPHETYLSCCGNAVQVGIKPPSSKNQAKGWISIAAA